MKIQFNPQLLLSQKNREAVMKGAEDAGLPFEIYAFKALDGLLSGDKPQQLSDDVVQQKAEVVAAKAAPPEKKEKPAPKKDKPQVDAGPFDHLNLHDHGKLGTRAHNLLVKFFKSVDDFTQNTYQELLSMKGVGQKSVDLIVHALIEEGVLTGPEDLGAAVEAEAEEIQLAELTQDQINDMNVKQLRTALTDLDLPYDGDREELQDRLSTVYFGTGVVAVDDGLAILAEQPEEDFGAELMELDSTDRESISEAARIYMKAWNCTREATSAAIKKIVATVPYDGNDPDTYEPSLRAIRDNLPMTPEQQDEVLSLGRQLGEDENSTFERAIAMCEKEFTELTLSEADALITEMTADLESEVPSVDDSFTF